MKGGRERIRDGGRRNASAENRERDKRGMAYSRLQLCKKKTVNKV